jgi:hypothetical protein
MNIFSQGYVYKFYAEIVVHIGVFTMSYGE